MVAVILDDLEGVERRLRALVHPIIALDWIETVTVPQTIEDNERAAEKLDILIDILEDSGIGVQRRLVPADEVVEWSSERKLVVPANEAGFRLSVNPEGGINIRIGFEDKTFVEHGLTPEAIATLVNSFANLRLASPYR
ncbi:hypothetical protein SAMN04488117_10287 [Celeribacter baekdonensis]|uniref:Uncharacterized protein n=1 Tax=Celeribacter baekdonensis TaxID=875171 RepID=A0A1G7HVG1_9RHOB|nr:hypothetical protein [Celeribacter baekdonensis]SDF04276.1 hypothetical protein SAMN04488117_10287 [Celeribacter baekdonensis]